MDSKDIQKRFDNVSRSKTFRNIIYTYDLSNKKVLDIGCTHGEFLAHFGTGSVGLTVIKEEVEEGKKRGFDVRYGDIEAIRSVDLKDRFDVIFANNIFEHLASPHNFLLNIKSFLNSDGILILGVPCIPKIVSLVRFNKFRGSLASLHINFFTKDTLVRTVLAGGWIVETVGGFRLRNRYFDKLLNMIYPHFYVIARMNNDFKYSEKRFMEMEGYDLAGRAINR